jgi:hypothetical protein
VLQDHETHFDIVAKDAKGRDVGAKVEQTKKKKQELQTVDFVLCKGAGMPFAVVVKGPRGVVPSKLVDQKVKHFCFKTSNLILLFLERFLSRNIHSHRTRLKQKKIVFLICN